MAASKKKTVKRKPSKKKTSRKNRTVGFGVIG